MNKSIKEILISGEQITQRCKELAEMINADYQGQKIVLLGLLKGSIPFLAELSKYIEVDASFDYMKVSSYDGVESKTLVVKHDMEGPVAGKNIVIVEDIIDTGKTLANVVQMLYDREAKSIKIATMLDKVEARQYDVQADYVGFEIPNAFVVGYGLDFNERFRQLPYVGVLKESCYK